MPHVPTPHDAIVKRILGKPENAASELKLVLPREISALVDWPSLKLCPGSFVDSLLAERRTDLLFSVRYAGNEARIYVLFEHQSTIDWFMPFRILAYIVRIWEAFLRDNPGAKRLPAIVPVVLYHSERDGVAWSGPTKLSQIIDLAPAQLASFAGLVPELEFILDDISRSEDEDLRKRTAEAAAALFLLRDARSKKKNLLDGLERWQPVLAQIAEAPDALQALCALLEYILRVGDIPRKSLEEFVRRLSPVTQEAFMTTAEMLANEGRVEGKAELVLRQLALRFGTLPEGTKARVTGATSGELDLLAERLLTASNVEDALG